MCFDTTIYKFSKVNVYTTILLCTCSDVEMALCPVRLSRYVRLMMASFRGMWEMRMSPDFVSAIIATLSISLSIHIHCTYMLAT